MPHDLFLAPAKENNPIATDRPLCEEANLAHADTVSSLWFSIQPLGMRGVARENGSAHLRCYQDRYTHSDTATVTRQLIGTVDGRLEYRAKRTRPLRGRPCLP
jgi:hypothetical protein